MRCSPRSRPCAPCSEDGRAHARCAIVIECCEESRQLRPAGVPGSARAAHRHARPRGRPRFGLRQLRAALGHDIAARPRERRADGRSADRGRAFGRRERRRRFELSHRAAAARPHRRRRDGHGEARGVPRADPDASASSRRSAPRPCSGEEIHGKFPFVPGMRPMARIAGGARSEPHAGARCSPSPAPTACRRPPARATCCGRKRCSTLSLRIAAHGGRADGGREAQGDSGGRSAVRREGELRVRPGRHRLERAADRAVAGTRHRRSVARRTTASRRCGWARAAPYRSWRCWARSFRSAQFLITGVLGPHSNAHGPNEFLHIDYATKLTAAVADVLAAQAAA